MINKKSSVYIGAFVQQLSAKQGVMTLKKFFHYTIYIKSTVADGGLFEGLLSLAPCCWLFHNMPVNV